MRAWTLEPSHPATISERHGSPDPCPEFPLTGRETCATLVSTPTR